MHNHSYYSLWQSIHSSSAGAYLNSYNSFHYVKYITHTNIQESSQESGGSSTLNDDEDDNDNIVLHCTALYCIALHYIICLQRQQVCCKFPSLFPLSSSSSSSYCFPTVSFLPLLTTSCCHRITHPHVTSSSSSSSLFA